MIGIVIAFCGGRPVMVSGAAGLVALVAAALVHAHGLQYLLAAILLTGVIQVVFGLLRLEVLMRFVSRSVRVGFVNAPAILIFSAQVPQMLGVSWRTYATETTSSKRRECVGLGLANCAAGMFGGIAGCGMIGQTVGNIRYGGRGRLSTLVAGLLLLLLMVALRPWIARVPVAALVSIMIMVSISTFSWASMRTLLTHPKVSSVVMLATVAVVVATKDLAVGVAIGVLLSGVFFAFKVMRLMEVRSTLDQASGTRVYTVSGKVFFTSAEMFADAFDLRDTAKRVRIDLHAAHLWDVTAVGALEGVVGKLRRHGIQVELAGLNEASAILIDRHGGVGLVEP